MNEFWAQVIPALFSVLGIIVAALIGLVGKYIIAYLSANKQAIINKIGADQYNSAYNTAKSIFFIVEEQFRTSVTKVTEEKIKLFNDLLLEKIPSLTQEDIDHFRQAIAGEFNAIIKGSGILDPAEKAAAIARMGMK